ncbi:hypothetical protein YC2023_071405 [Brassica napus]
MKIFTNYCHALKANKRCSVVLEHFQRMIQNQFQRYVVACWLQNGDKQSVGPHLSMNSRHVLRVIHGTWNLHQNGEWSFERKTNDLGFPAIVRTLENFDSLERIV